MSTIEKKSLKVGKYVNAEHVDTLIRNYKTERWLQNSKNLGKDDTVGVWYSAEELEEFIQMARLHGADGIRLCFGVYGKDGCREGMEGRQTVALIATCSEEEEKDMLVHKDLYINQNGKAGLVAYNMAFPFPPTTTTTMKGEPVVGSVMVMDKDRGMRIV